MNISIIIPIYNQDKQILKRIEDSIKIQKFDGKIEIIKINKGLGLADSLNYGIKKAKYKVIVSLHQDCIPENDKWLKKLIDPLKDKEVVASVSKVELPYEFWKNFNFFAKIMSAKEQRIITPLLDEKGCAYKKSALLKTGLFDSERFRTAGEDFDMYLKLKKIGKIAYPDCKVNHFHCHSFIGRLKKEFQLSEGFGALVRIYKKKMPKLILGFIKAIPLLGWLVFVINFPYKRFPILSIFWVPLSILIHIIFCFGFWKGFIRKKQTF